MCTTGREDHPAEPLQGVLIAVFAVRCCCPPLPLVRRCVFASCARECARAPLADLNAATAPYQPMSQAELELDAVNSVALERMQQRRNRRRAAPMHLVGGAFGDSDSGSEDDLRPLRDGMVNSGYYKDHVASAGSLDLHGIAPERYAGLGERNLLVNQMQSMPPSSDALRVAARQRELMLAKRQQDMEWRAATENEWPEDTALPDRSEQAVQNVYGQRFAVPNSLVDRSIEARLPQHFAEAELHQPVQLLASQEPRSVGDASLGHHGIDYGSRGGDHAAGYSEVRLPPPCASRASTQNFAVRQHSHF
jgi:hypothetical protein